MFNPIPSVQSYVFQRDMSTDYLIAQIARCTAKINGSVPIYMPSAYLGTLANVINGTLVALHNRGVDIKPICDQCSYVWLEDVIKFSYIAWHGKITQAYDYQWRAEQIHEKTGITVLETIPIKSRWGIQAQ